MKPVTIKKKNKPAGIIGVIDFERKGNVVRFYMGDTSADYWGDDWDDVPYEHNAEQVYSEYVDHYIDVAFPIDTEVLEPKDDWRNNGNSPYSKQDMKERKCPCIIIVPKASQDVSMSDCYTTYISDETCARIFFGDTLELLDDCETLNIAKRVTSSTIIL